MKSNVLAALVLALAACGGTTTSSNTATSGTHAAGSAANGSGNNGSGTNGSGTGASSSTTSTNGSTTGANSTGATSNGTGASTGATSSGTGANTTGANSTTGTNGNCVPDGQFSSDPNACCSGAVDGNGYCISASVTGATSGTGSTTGATSTGTGSNTTGTTGSGTSATNGGSTTGATATGTTTGGTCPNNMPNLVTGQGGRGVGACNTNPGSPACPKGYTCNNGQCSLNSSSTLQVTLSFDDIEDFDLHLMEPLSDGGYCEIFYGNPGNNPDAGSICQFAPMFCTDGGFHLPGSGNACPSGWLDRDTNAACGSSGGSGGSGGGQPDGVNVENILFANNQPAPSGTYYVLVDYWQNCDDVTCSDGQDQNACNGYPTSNLGVQVRLPDSAIYQYCPVISESGQGPNDQSAAHGGAFPDGAGAGSGFLVTSFTIP